MVVIGGANVPLDTPVIYSDGDIRSKQLLADKGFWIFYLATDTFPLNRDLLFLGGFLASSYHTQVHDQLIAEGQPHFEERPDETPRYIIVDEFGTEYRGLDAGFTASATSPFDPTRRVTLVAGIGEEGTYNASYSSAIIVINASRATDRYSRYHGKSVDEPLHRQFWTYEPEKIIGLASSTINHGQVVFGPPGAHYVEYGTSSPSGYTWYARIFKDGSLIAEGYVTSYDHLIGDFTILEPPLPAGFGQYVSDDLPTQADPGSIVVVAVTVRNDGVDSDIGVQAVDADTDIILDGPTRVSQLAGETAIHTVSFTMPSVPLNVRFDCGHYSGTEF